ncbi:hypothetical protein OG782_13095 [Streptomyces sp. NBC_00876]|uniref:hypothetical protein n=1 Tax=Streptomyces sp. NBC_00876 TaxID=2975853 RepID=UPI00386CF8A4|nr:hypothetical protein OG782_13095 [Streptomyces sp. NBC_00876]
MRENIREHRVVLSDFRFLASRFMNDEKKVTAPPAHVMASALSPDPEGNCDVCGALAKERTEAVRVGDWSKVVDINVEIGRHRAETPG